MYAINEHQNHHSEPDVWLINESSYPSLCPFSKSLFKIDLLHSQMKFEEATTPYQLARVRLD